MESEETGYRAALLNSGGRGRPSYQISREQLVYYLRERFSRREVADMLRVSLSTVARRIRATVLSETRNMSATSLLENRSLRKYTRKNTRI